MIKGMLREIYFYGGESEEDQAIRRNHNSLRGLAELAALCPACGFEHAFRVDLEGHGKWKDDNKPWTFNGDYDCPTFYPSMGANLYGNEKHHPICHSFLENGHWMFLDDSTHEMAGKIVPMIPPDPNMNWEKRHGWHLFPWTDNEGRPIKENK